MILLSIDGWTRRAYITRVLCCFSPTPPAPSVRVSHKAYAAPGTTSRRSRVHVHARTANVRRCDYAVTVFRHTRHRYYAACIGRARDVYARWRPIEKNRLSARPTTTRRGDDPQDLRSDDENSINHQTRRRKGHRAFACGYADVSSAPHGNDPCGFSNASDPSGVSGKSRETGYGAV